MPTSADLIAADQLDQLQDIMSRFPAQPRRVSVDWTAHIPYRRTNRDTHMSKVVALDLIAARQKACGDDPNDPETQAYESAYLNIEYGVNLF